MAQSKTLEVSVSEIVNDELRFGIKSAARCLIASAQPIRLSILCSSETRLMCRNADETLCSNQTDKSVLFSLRTAASEQSLQPVEGSITSSSITSNDHK